MDVYNTILSKTFLDIIAAIIIILFGLIFGNLISKLIKKVFKELEVDHLLEKQTNKKIFLEDSLGSIIKYLIYFVALIIALNQLGLTATILYIILGIILLFLVIFIILSVKDFIPNFISGIFLYRKRLMKIGDKIKVRDIEGEIINISVVETKIKTLSGDEVYIPNSILTKEVFIKKK